MSQENDAAVDVNGVNDAPKMWEDRSQKRFVRRWKRRARILGPFLGIPLVFGALALSMDFVRHLPAAQMAPAQATAVKTRRLAAANRPTERFVRSSRDESASVVASGVARPIPSSIVRFHSNSMSLDMSDTHTDSAHVAVQPFRKQHTR